MPRSMVGLLAAVATAMPALVPFAHGFLILVLILDAAAAAALIATAAVQSTTSDQLATLDPKKICENVKSFAVGTGWANYSR
jgi:hypothetical protein